MTSFSQILSQEKQDFVFVFIQKIPRYLVGCKTYQPWALHGLASRSTRVMTSFSHILINMHFSIFIEQKLFEYKIIIRYLTDNSDNQLLSYFKLNQDNIKFSKKL